MKYLLVLFISISFSGFAGEGSWVQRLSLNEVMPNVNYTMSAPSWNYQEAFEYKNRVGLIHLDYTRKDHSDLTFSNQWRIQVSVDYIQAGTTYSKNLEISSEEGLYQFSDYIKFGLSPNETGFIVNITSITGEYFDGLNWEPSANPQNDNNFPLDVDVKFELREELWYDLDVSANDAEKSRLEFDPSTFRANWRYFQGAEQYDFEWVWIDELSQEFAALSSIPNGMSEGEYAFSLKKSTRIRLSHTHHSMDKTYLEGRIYFRVRAISKYIDPSTGVIDQVKEGEWNYVNQSGQIVKTTISAPSSFEKDKNWLYGIAYAEEGKSVSSVTFYDGSNRGRQSLTYNTSDDITLIGESKFDREGRQTVSIVPAPVSGRSLGYRTGFNLANPTSPGSTAIFDEEDFDFADYLSSQAVPLLTNDPGESGAAQYFSGNNQFNDDLFRAAIPNANGYVYSQTIYRNDGSGRIERVGGIGETFIASGDHAVRTFYGSPSQVELQRLFGSNVSNSPNGYRKEMVRDANGQYSVTYYDKRGNVIATALAGNTPDNLLALPDQNEELITTSITANNIIDNANYTSIAEHTHLSALDNDQITLNYDLNGAVNTIGSQTVTVEGQSFNFSELCASCEYHVKIEVKNQFGAYVIPSDIGNAPIGSEHYEQSIVPSDPCYVVDVNGDLQPNPNQSAQTAASLISPNLIYNLGDAGEYYIIKTLTVDLESMQANLDAQMDAGNVNSAQDFIDDYIGNLDFSIFEGCFYSCDEYCDAYQKALFLENTPGAVEADWDPTNNPSQQAAIDVCVAEECNIDEQFDNFNSDELGQGILTINPIDLACDGFRAQMIAQISPGGVFYDNINSSFWSDVAAAAPLNIGGTDYSTVELQASSNFTDEIANALLPFHREYCHIADVGNGESYCSHWAETMNYSNGLLSKFQDNVNYPFSLTTSLYTAPYSEAAYGYPSDPFLGMTDFNGNASLGNGLLEEAVSNYYNYLGYGTLPANEQLCSPVQQSISSGLAVFNVEFGAASGNANTGLQHFVANMINCAIQNDPSPSVDHYKQVASLMYKSLYDGIKQKLMYDFVETQCTYYTDANRVIPGPMTPTQIAQSVNAGFASIIGGVDCEELAFNNANNWINQIPNTCLTELEQAGYHSSAFGDDPAVDQTTLDAGTNYNYVNGSINTTVSGAETLEQLFYDYTLATCPDNTWGWFFNPDENDANYVSGDPTTILNQTPNESGEVEFIQIHNILSSTTGCGQTILGVIEVSPAPTMTTTTLTNQNFFDCFDDLIQSINDGLALHNIDISTNGYSTNCNPPVNLPMYNECVTSSVPVSIVTNECNIQGTLDFITLRNPSSNPYDYHIDMSINSGSTCTAKFILDQDSMSSPLVSVSNPVRHDFYTNYLGIVLPEIITFLGTLEDGSQVVLYITALHCFDSVDFSNQSITNVVSGLFDLPSFTSDCIETTIAEAEINAEQIYNEMLDELQNQYLSDLSNCLTNAVENFTMTYTLKEYQYTLYYYDLAGNLVQTVPPQGVDIIPMGTIDDMGTPSDVSDDTWDGFNPLTGELAAGEEPIHKMETRYKYNGLNTLVAQYTPDGGHSDFVLDKLYRVRYSQNARQKDESKASYTKYDELGRVEEAGEMYIVNNSISFLESNAEDNTFPTAQMRMDHTITYYEEKYPNDASIETLFTGGAQKNLRNTIGAIEHNQATYSGGIPLQGSSVKTVISYSYDAHKNVQEMVSTNYDLATIGQQHKTVRYEYDLISGNVNELIYQEDRDIQLDQSSGDEELYTDEYRHRYHYDANNRLIRAFTSKDGGTTWDKEAKYFYYLHGALARTELGEDEVQGSDYAYNLQGWLKGVNASSLDASRDFGHDSHTSGDNQYFGADAHGFMLSYFENDYQSIAPTTAFADITGVTDQNVHPINITSDAPKNLYNGNIHNMVTALRDYEENPMTVLSNNYQYDQLQRIRSMKVYYSSLGELITGNHFDDAQLYNNGAYQTSYTFDKNGNLKTLNRFGDDGTKKMDEFTYKYYDVSGGTALTNDPNESNRLASVLDDPNLTTNYADIDIDEGQVNLNYQYDASGQLISDDQEGIQEIVWSVTGKVKEIKFTQASGKNDLKFVYDPMDMRVMKVEYLNSNRTSVKYTYYSCDAQGNVLATYTRTIGTPKNQVEGQLYEDLFYLEENIIYGSSRLGIDNRGLLLTTASITQPIAGSSNIELAENFVWTLQSVESHKHSHRLVGRKYYELSNHLGNVLEVITDRKLGVMAGTINVYSADVVSYSDYYPYGMLLPGRHGEEKINGYRYSFQGQEHDDEMEKGKGNSISYKYRMHDPRIGRFFAVDPLSPKYPWYTPYSFSGNKVIAYREIEGLEETFYMPVIDMENSTMRIEIVNNYCTGKIETLFGEFSITDYTGDNNYIIGSDEKWHKIPGEFLNKSLCPVDMTVEEAMDRIDSWPIVSDKLYRIAENLEAFDNFVNSEFGLAIGLLATNVSTLRAKSGSIRKKPAPSFQKRADKGNRIKNTLIQKKTIANPYLKGKAKINGRKIVNSHYAGTTVETKGGSVTFDEYGFPNFEKYSVKTVRVEGLTGDMGHDIPLAMEEAGMTSYDKNLVWHHHQDGKSMMLVPKNVHSTANGGISHSGGRAVIKHNIANPNDQLNYPSPEIK